LAPVLLYRVSRNINAAFAPICILIGISRKYKCLAFLRDFGKNTNMAHMRKRHAQDAIQKLLQFSSLIGIFGHRQVGKTTFLEKTAASYISFDDKKTILAAKDDPDLFLRNLGKKPAGIDECQYVEDLFPALKELVRKNKRPGQIILSGSVRFYSRKAIRESLTGRIVNVDLLPMVLTELAEVERARLPLKLIERENFGHDLNQTLSATILKKRTKLIDSYLAAGGLPGVCFLRNERLRSERLRDQLMLILDRDLRLIYPSSVPYVQILEFVRMLALQEGQPVQPTLIRKEIGLAETTQKKLLQALEAVFLIRLLAIEGDRKGICVYFEDQAEHLFLHEQKLDPLKAFEGLVYRNLRGSFNYELGHDFRFFQFHQRPDVRVPFAIRTKAGCLGIIPFLEEDPTRQDLRKAHRFLQRYSPATVLMVSKSQAETKILEPRILQIPAERLLFD
jgi:predicted AAA+ superfamily ATPase